MNRKTTVLKVLVAGVIALTSFASVKAEDAKAGLEVGDKVSAFMAIDQEGKLWKLEDLLGEKNLVVYFFPAAMTGGSCGV